MKCPYCVLDIDDKSIACRHCNRDLFFLRPVLDRIDELARVVEVLTQGLAQLEAKVTSQVTAPNGAIASAAAADPLFRSPYVVVPLGATTASVVLYWSFRHFFFSHILLIASIVSPFPAGLILGLWWPGRHLRVYVIQGIAIGFMNMVGMLVVHGSVPKTYLDTAVFSFVFGGAMLYVSGAWIGDWIEGRQSPGPSSLVRMIAQRLGGDQLAAKSGTPRIAATITAIGPVLTFIASLVGAYVSYVAALKKNS
jgi:hypothetical protein